MKFAPIDRHRGAFPQAREGTGYGVSGAIVVDQTRYVRCRHRATRIQRRTGNVDGSDDVEAVILTSQGAIHGDRVGAEVAQIPHKKSAKPGNTGSDRGTCGHIDRSQGPARAGQACACSQGDLTRAGGGAKCVWWRRNSPSAPVVGPA